MLMKKKVVKKTTHDDIEADLLGLYENYIWTIIIHLSESISAIMTH